MKRFLLALSLTATACGPKTVDVASTGCDHLSGSYYVPIVSTSTSANACYPGGSVFLDWFSVLDTNGELVLTDFFATDEGVSYAGSKVVASGESGCEFYFNESYQDGTEYGYTFDRMYTLTNSTRLDGSATITENGEGQSCSDTFAGGGVKIGPPNGELN